MNLASRTKRILNAIIDALVGMLLWLSFWIFAGTTLIKNEEFVKAMEGQDFGWTIHIALFVYYLCVEGIFGTSLGKIITRTTIVHINGDKITFYSVFKRSLLRLIPWDFLTFFSKNSIGWHDKYSNTRVVNINK